MSTEPTIDLATVPTGPFAPTEVHARLARLRGRWEGTARTYFDIAPGEDGVGGEESVGVEIELARMP